MSGAPALDSGTGTRGTWSHSDNKHVSHENTASPSFFLLQVKPGGVMNMTESCSSGSLASLNNNPGRSNNDSEHGGGAWTKVTTKKTKATYKTKQRQKHQQQHATSRSKHNNGKQSIKKGHVFRRYSTGSSTVDVKQQLQHQVKWRVPHQTQQAVNKVKNRKSYKQAAKGIQESRQNQQESKSYQASRKINSGILQSLNQVQGSDENFNDKFISEASATAAEYLKLYKEISAESNFYKEKLRLKLWNILFRNINRSVDELYYMCEFESSDIQCEEAIKTLQLCIVDFKQLRDRIRTQDEFADKSEEQRPSGLAWEVRRSRTTPEPIIDIKVQERRHFKSIGNVKDEDDEEEEKMPGFVTLSTSRGNPNPPVSDNSADCPETDSISSNDDRTCYYKNGKSLEKSPSSHEGRRENHNAVEKKTSKFQSAWLKKPNIIPESASTFLSKSAEKSIKQQQEQKLNPQSKSREQGSGHHIQLQKPNNNQSPTGSPVAQQQEQHIRSSEKEPEEKISKLENNQESDNSISSVFPVPRQTMSWRWSDDYEDSPAKPIPIEEITKNKRVRNFPKDLVVRTLHEKLSSPERRKPSPCETRRRQVAKQANAELNRAKLEKERQEKLKAHSSRQIQAAKIKQEELLAQERAISEKLKRAAVARKANLKKVAKKAENESQKVHEILFINEMTELNREAQHYKKLEASEKRRQEFIGTIRGKAEKQSERAQARKLREEGRERQLREAMQKRHQDAEKRKAEAWEEQKRRLDEMHVEALAKVSERRTEMEREREAKLAAIKEREERVEVERKKVMLARQARLGFGVVAAGNTKISLSRSPPPTDIMDDQKRELFPNHPNSSHKSNNKSELHKQTSFSTIIPGSSTEAVAIKTKNNEVEVTEAKETHEKKNKNASSSNGNISINSPSNSSYVNQRLKEKSKVLKKRSRKVRQRIASLCDKIDASKLIATYSTSSSNNPQGQGKLSKRKQKAIREIKKNYSFNTADDEKDVNVIHKVMTSGKLDSIDSALKDLLRYVQSAVDVDMDNKDDLFIDMGEGIEVLLKLCTPEGALCHPKQTNDALVILTTVCTLRTDVCNYIIAKNRAVPIIDMAVCILREDSFASNINRKEAMDCYETIDRINYQDEEHIFSTLIQAFSLIRILVASEFSAVSDEDQKSYILILEELCKYSVQSTLILRLEGRLEQLRRGGQWLGCSMRVANANSMTENQVQVEDLTLEKEDNLENASISELERTLALVGKGYGLIEGLILAIDGFVQKSEVAVSPLIEAAKDSCIFNVVSILVSLYFAVEAQQMASTTHNFHKHMRIVVHVGLRLVNLMALADVKFVQDTLGSPTMEFEFQKLLRNVLRSCTLLENESNGIVETARSKLETKPTSSNLPMPPEQYWNTGRQKLIDLERCNLESLFSELIVLMGFYAQCNERNQESLNWGCAPTPLSSLCSLHFKYFCSQVGKAILIPTIISICFGNVSAVNIAAKNCSPALLTNYLIERERQNDTAFSVRFPRENWQKAIHFFKNFTFRD